MSKNIFLRTSIIIVISTLGFSSLRPAPPQDSQEIPTPTGLNGYTVIEAASGSMADIQTALDAARSGDIIIIPSGFFSSTNGSLSCTQCPAGTYAAVSSGATTCTVCSVCVHLECYLIFLSLSAWIGK